MGYTHYWSHDVNLDKQKLFAAMLHAVRIVEAAKAKGIELAGPSGEGEPMLDEGIALNGVGEESHESFVFPNNPHDQFYKYTNAEHPGRLWAFCKTARKSYDIVVCAILLVMKHHLGNQLRVASDGGREEDEWIPAENLVREVLGYEVQFQEEETLEALV